VTCTAQDIIKTMQEVTGQNISKTNVPPSELPEAIEEVEMHMQLSYKQSIEIAEEEAINNVLAKINTMKLEID
jgi:predicted transcriptional regulator